MSGVVRQTTSPRVDPGWPSDLVGVQVVPKTPRYLSQDDRTEIGRQIPANGNGRNAPAVVRSGEAGMNLWESLKRIWTGETLLDEEEKSRQVRTDVRKTIAETRAMLNGEDGWLIPPDRDSCSDRK